MSELRVTYKRTIKKYEQAFGPKHEEFKYMIKPTKGSGIVLCVVQEYDVSYVVKDQVLVRGKKIYRDYELVADLAKKDLV